MWYTQTWSQDCKSIVHRQVVRLRNWGKDACCQRSCADIPCDPGRCKRPFPPEKCTDSTCQERVASSRIKSHQVASSRMLNIKAHSCPWWDSTTKDTDGGSVELKSITRLSIARQDSCKISIYLERVEDVNRVKPIISTHASCSAARTSSVDNVAPNALILAILAENCSPCSWTHVQNSHPDPSCKVKGL